MEHRVAVVVIVVVGALRIRVPVVMAMVVMMAVVMPMVMIKPISAGTLIGVPVTYKAATAPESATGKLLKATKGKTHD